MNQTARALGSVLARPPWPILVAVSAAGWLLLIALDTRGSGAICGEYRQGGLALWGVMLVAMTPPLLTHPLRRVWRSSLVRRRVAAVALFVSAYFGVWMVAGGVFLATASLAALTFPAVILLAVAWQFLPIKAPIMTACHRAPRLRTVGRGAFADNLGYGVRLGSACVGACWPLMLAPLVAPSWHMAVMAVVTVVMVADRHWMSGGNR